MECNKCIACNKFNDTLFKCIEYDVALNLYQILKERECRRFIESMDKLVDT